MEVMVLASCSCICPWDVNNVKMTSIIVQYHVRTEKIRKFGENRGTWRNKKYHVSPLSILGHYFDVVSLGKALHPHMLHLTQVQISTW